MNKMIQTPGRSDISVRLRLLIAVFGLVVASTGCVHMYVDPQYRSATYKDIQYTNNPPLVELSVEFQFNGTHWKSQDTDLRQHLVRFLAASKVFEAAANTNIPTVGTLQITLNDTGNVGAAAGKGFVTGLTYGIIGSEVEDHYIMTAIYKPANGTAFTGKYQYSIHSTIGIHATPKGLEPISPSEAENVVIEDTMLNFLRDWQKQQAIVPGVVIK